VSAPDQAKRERDSDCHEKEATHHGEQEAHIFGAAKEYPSGQQEPDHQAATAA
jgi:hypothetical protein